VGRWGQQWELSHTRVLPGIERLRNWLERNVTQVPKDLPSAIVHGDYRVDNVIWQPHSNQILAVVDWEMATLGDPVSDLAIALVYWSQAGDTLRGQVPVAEHITEAPGFWDRDQLVTHYRNLTGFDLVHLDFCIALACFKLAVIMESIHKRNMAGQQLGAAGVNDDHMGQATIALAELGLATIVEGAAALGR
jgi:aminoglycoside phosphotransferase (APT) family kinase protein